MCEGGTLCTASWFFPRTRQRGHSAGCVCAPLVRPHKQVGTGRTRCTASWFAPQTRQLGRSAGCPCAPREPPRSLCPGAAGTAPCCPLLSERPCSSRRCTPAGHLHSKCLVGRPAPCSQHCTVCLHGPAWQACWIACGALQSRPGQASRPAAMHTATKCRQLIGPRPACAPCSTEHWLQTTQHRADDARRSTRDSLLSTSRRRTAKSERVATAYGGLVAAQLPALGGHQPGLTVHDAQLRGACSTQHRQTLHVEACNSLHCANSSQGSTCMMCSSVWPALHWRSREMARWWRCKHARAVVVVG